MRAVVNEVIKTHPPPLSLIHGQTRKGDPVPIGAGARSICVTWVQTAALRSSHQVRRTTFGTFGSRLRTLVGLPVREGRG
jgi:hypothetical protein